MAPTLRRVAHMPPTPTMRAVIPASTTLTRALRDPRDAPVLALVIRLVLLLVPLAALLFLRFHWAIAVVYLALIQRYSAPFAGLIHEATHRRLFVPRWSALGTFFVEWIVAPSFGMSPYLYAAQHVGMHHAENNLEDDASATIAYQRDSIAQYALYFLRFLFAAHWEVLGYLRARGKQPMLRRAALGLAAHYAVIAAALAYDWRAALTVLIVPMVFMRLAFSAGNWAQHGFIDPDAPDSPLGNTITCVEPRFNRETFNSGYHSAHHAAPRVHWSELPDALSRDFERYRAERAVVFVGVEYAHVFVAMMLRRYRWLAERHADYGEELSVVEARLRLRLRPARQRSAQGP